MKLSSEMPIYATSLDGADIYAAELSKTELLLWETKEMEYLRIKTNM